MDVHEIVSFEELAGQHADVWRRITATSNAATIFQTWEWTEAWWRHHGGGKRLRALCFAENGVSVGYSALFVPSVPFPFRTARFVGTGASDYLDLIAAPGSEDAVAEAFRAYHRENLRSWDWIDLQQVRPGAVAERLVGSSGAIRVETWRGDTCPYLPLAPTWEAFRKTLGKNMRQNVGLRTRGLEKKYRVEYRLANAQTLDADLEDFFDLHQRRCIQRGLAGLFASPLARAFHKEAARALLDAGMLRLHLLLLDDEARAALYCFQKGGTCYYYQGGFEPSLAKLSLGTALFAHAMRHAIEADHAREFDFLRGDEDYKYRWGSRNRFNVRLSLTHSGLRPALLEQSTRTTLSLKRRLESWVRRAGLLPMLRSGRHALRTFVDR